MTIKTKLHRVLDEIYPVATTTIDQLSQLLGIPKSTAHRLRSANGEPSQRTLSRLNKVLGLDDKDWSLSVAEIVARAVRSASPLPSNLDIPLVLFRTTQDASVERAAVGQKLQGLWMLLYVSARGVLCSGPFDFRMPTQFGIPFYFENMARGEDPEHPTIYKYDGVAHALKSYLYLTAECTTVCRELIFFIFSSHDIARRPSCLFGRVLAHGVRADRTAIRTARVVLLRVPQDRAVIPRSLLMERSWEEGLRLWKIPAGAAEYLQGVDAD